MNVIVVQYPGLALRRSKCLKQAHASNTSALNNKVGPWLLLVSRTESMLNRDSCGHSYSIVRYEILGCVNSEYSECICHGYIRGSPTKVSQRGDQVRADTALVLAVNHSG